MLVDLHRQFDTLALGNTHFQRNVIDALAGNETALAAYKKTYTKWTTLTAEIQALIEKKTFVPIFIAINQHSLNSPLLRNESTRRMIIQASYKQTCL